MRDYLFGVCGSSVHADMCLAPHQLLIQSAGNLNPPPAESDHLVALVARQVQECCA